MWNTELEEAQAWIEIAGRNINNLRYADNTTLMAESEEELKSLLMKLKEDSENTDLKLRIQKTKITASGPISSVQLSSVAQSCLTLCNPMDQACPASLSITNSQSLLKLMSIKSVMPSSHLFLCCPLLLPPSIFPTFRVFSNASVLRIRWSKSFSFSISPSNEYSGLIYFRMD